MVEVLQGLQYPWLKEHGNENKSESQGKTFDIALKEPQVRWLACNPVLYPICQLYHLIELKTYFTSQSNSYCLWRALHSIFVFFAAHFIPIRNNLFVLNVKLPIIILKHLNVTYGNIILRLRLDIDLRRRWMFLGLGGANRCGCNNRSISQGWYY